MYEKEGGCDEYCTNSVTTILRLPTTTRHSSLDYRSIIIIMSDTGRQSLTDKATAALKPQSEKSTTQRVGDTFSSNSNNEQPSLDRRPEGRGVAERHLLMRHSGVQKAASPCCAINLVTTVIAVPDTILNDDVTRTPHPCILERLNYDILERIYEYLRPDRGFSLTFAGVWRYPMPLRSRWHPISLAEAFSQMPRLSRIKIDRTLREGVPWRALNEILAVTHLRYFEVDGTLQRPCDGTVVDEPGGMLPSPLAPLACYHQVLEDYRSPPRDLPSDVVAVTNIFGAQDFPGGELVSSENNPAIVELDTGTSLSYVPDAIIERLRTVTFKCPENEDDNKDDKKGDKKGKKVSGTEEKPSFVVPHRLVGLDYLWVELRSMGRDRTTVQIYLALRREAIGPSAAERDAVWNELLPIHLCRPALAHH
ncbi:hypothetical protein ACG7TL_004749 [Trametes sanguinea]